MNISDLTGLTQLGESFKKISINSSKKYKVNITNNMFKIKKFFLTTWNKFCYGQMQT